MQDNFFNIHVLPVAYLKPKGENFDVESSIYLEVSEDNTKHTYQEFNKKISQECLDRLLQIVMVDDAVTNDHGYDRKWKSKLPFLHPIRHIPPTNSNNDLNMSLVEGFTFAN